MAAASRLAPAETEVGALAPGVGSDAGAVIATLPPAGSGSAARARQGGDRALRAVPVSSASLNVLREAGVRPVLEAAGRSNP
jgi:hypothetical protein